MNQRRSLFIPINLTSEAKRWLAKRTPRMVVTAPGNLCRVLEAALKQFRKSSPSPNLLTAATATISAPSETPLKSSQSSLSAQEMRLGEGSQWDQTPTPQTAQAPFSSSILDFKWPTPPYISTSDLAKCGYPHIYTVLENGLKMLGWAYDIHRGRWYPPPSIPQDVQQSVADRPKGELHGKDNLQRETSTPQGGFRIAGERKRTRW